MKIDPWLKTWIRRQGYAALYVAGPVEIVPKRMGDNCGCRPIMLGVTTAWDDTISNGLNRASWNVAVKVLFRIWCRDVMIAKSLHSLIEGWFRENHDPMRYAWTDLGPNLDVARLQKAMRALARDYNIVTLSDGELVALGKSENAKPAKQLKRAYT